MQVEPENPKPYGYSINNPETVSALWNEPSAEEMSCFHPSGHARLLVGQHTQDRIRIHFRRFRSRDRKEDREIPLPRTREAA